MSSEKHGFVMVSSLGFSAQIAKVDMPSSSFRVLFELMSKTGYDGLAKCTQADIARDTGIARPNVSRAISVLTSSGVVRNRSRGVWQINPAYIWRGNNRSHLIEQWAESEFKARSTPKKRKPKTAPKPKRQGTVVDFPEKSRVKK